MSRMQANSLSLPALLAPLALAACLLSACAQMQRLGPRPTPEPIIVTVAGSTDVRPLLIELTNVFTQRNPQLRFLLRGGGGRLGEQWLASGRADIAVSAALTPEADLPAGVLRIPIGFDALALVVHEANPADSLTTAQIRDLFSGHILDWNNLGAGGGEVLLVSREEGSAARALFERRLMGEESVARTAVVLSTGSDVVDFVASHQTAIGYAASSYLSGYKEPAPGGSAQAASFPRAPPAVKAVSIDGRSPSPADLASRNYPLTRPLFLLVRKDSPRPLQEFIEFAHSEEGQEIVARYLLPLR